LSAVSCKKTIEVDGNLGEWPEGYFLRGLTAPWDQIPKDSTSFQTFVDGEYLFFNFRTIDTTPFTVPFESELSVAAGDRVELFFSKTPDMSEDYYCLEMNPRGEVLDYRATYYRKFDYDWDASTLELATLEYPNGYQVEGSIEINELRELGLGNEFYLGVYRAEYRGKDQVTWYSWIVPDAENPDFHIPSSLARVKFAANAIEPVY
jgi:chondroitin AC lyase